MSKNIATAYVRFVQVSGGKRRPIFILQETEDKVFFFDITTKFKNKAEEIKKHYFEIKEYENTGLKNIHGLILIDVTRYLKKILMLNI